MRLTCLGAWGGWKIIQPRQKSSPQAMNLERCARVFGVVGWNVPLRLRYMQLGCVCYLLAHWPQSPCLWKRTTRTQKRLWLELAARDIRCLGGTYNTHGW